MEREVMNMKDKLIKLIDLKSIITLLMTVALITGFFMKEISTEVFIPFASMVFTFYFTKKKEE
jgi:hypothetical protein